MKLASAVAGLLIVSILPVPVHAGTGAEVITHGADAGVQVEAGGFDPAEPGGDGEGSGSGSGTEQVPEATSISLHNCIPVYGDTGVPTDSVQEGTGDCGALSPSEGGGGTEPDPEQMDPAAIASSVFERMVALAPHVTIDAAPSSGGLAGLPIYVWLEPSPEPVVAAVSLPGVRVEARADPTAVSWSFGDGSHRSAGPGRRWSQAAQGDVAHVYEKRGGYQISAKVLWVASWRTNGGAWQPLGGFETRGETSLRIRQMIAILSRG